MTPPAGVAIRALTPADAEAVAALVNLPGFRAGTLRLPFHTPDEVRAWMQQGGRRGLVLGAFVEGELVGEAGLRRLEGRRDHVGDIGMGVHDGWTGRGIGRALLAALVDTADRWLGLRRLELTVFADNAPAIALYRSAGFTLEGTHRGFALRDGMLVDAHSMARLAPPPALSPPS